MDIRQWLSRVSDDVIRQYKANGKDVLEDLEQSAVDRATILEPPCSEESLFSATRRLGFRLPLDYEAFLRISNGLVLPAFENHSIRIRPIQEIGRFKDVDRCSYESWVDGAPKVRFAPLSVMAKDVRAFTENVPDPAILHDAWLLSDVVSTGGILLCPYAGYGEGIHEIWELGPWSGCIRYRSFFDFLRIHMHEVLEGQAPQLDDIHRISGHQ
jgi:hypothetical protein